MKRIYLFFILLFLPLVSLLPIGMDDWGGAQWITADQCKNEANTWLSFRKVFSLDELPEKALSKIAVDSKYWLYVNGKMVVFEGGLKRGPNPQDSYYDEVDIGPYLKEGENSLAVLVWFFGRHGFAHKNSGKAGLLFFSQLQNLELISDESWRAIVNPAYGTCGPPESNYRLSESNILFDARKELRDWETPGYDDTRLPFAVTLGPAGCSPWNKLVRRPIPMWKDFGLKKFENTRKSGDTLYCSLPYNMQMTPYVKIRSQEGQKILFFTDNYTTYEANGLPVRSEYITRDGLQEYESLGWMNGHQLICVLPPGVELEEVMYRETGYDTWFEGKIQTSDPFYNKLVEKAVRTLYITMRDNYMDCPDRERAQWTGDAVNEAHEAFYALSLSSHLLGEKWLRELIGWQKDDGVIYAPVPSGNWDVELSGQSLASVGYFGLWTAYMYTGNKQLIEDLYYPARNYVKLWQINEKGLVDTRWGDWAWGDWGEEKDMSLLNALWYYIAVKGLHNIAAELHINEDISEYAAILTGFKKAFNEEYWTGECYRSSDYSGRNDERVQALAVVSGIAEKEKYPALLDVFLNEEHCSPYMEKYVFEAMMMMGYEAEAQERHKKRFSYMVEHPLTTLFEGWGMGEDGFGGGTVNHAWSGGGLTVLAQYVCGVEPVTPGFKTFSVLPRPGAIESTSLHMPTVSGNISSSYKNSATGFILEASVPENTTAYLGVPVKDYKKIRINNTLIWKHGVYLDNKKAVQPDRELSDSHIVFKVSSGEYRLVAN